MNNNDVGPGTICDNDFTSRHLRNQDMSGCTWGPFSGQVNCNKMHYTAYELCTYSFSAYTCAQVLPEGKACAAVAALQA